MSTDYRFKERSVGKDELLFILKDIGVAELVGCEGSNESRFCVADGSQGIWCYLGSDGRVQEFTRFGRNYRAEGFLQYVADHLDLTLMSEYDEGFFEEGGDDGEDLEDLSGQTVLSNGRVMSVRRKGL